MYEHQLTKSYVYFNATKIGIEIRKIVTGREVYIFGKNVDVGKKCKPRHKFY